MARDGLRGSQGLSAVCLLQCHRILLGQIYELVKAESQDGKVSKPKSSENEKGYWRDRIDEGEDSKYSESICEERDFSVDGQGVDRNMLTDDNDGDDGDGGDGDGGDGDGGDGDVMVTLIANMRDPRCMKTETMVVASTDLHQIRKRSEKIIAVFGCYSMDCCVARFEIQNGNLNLAFRVRWLIPWIYITPNSPTDYSNILILPKGGEAANTPFGMVDKRSSSEVNIVPNNLIKRTRVILNQVKCNH